MRTKKRESLLALNVPKSRWHEYPDEKFYEGLTQEEIDFVNLPITNDDLIERKPTGKQNNWPAPQS